MTAIMLSRVVGYVREAYIAWAFGAGPQTDAYVAGFTIPEAAEKMGISARKANQIWTYARAWLATEITDGSSA